MSFGSTPTTTTENALSANQIPVSSVAEPGRANGDLTALEGGPGSVDSNNNRTAPISVYVKDGGDTTFGAESDSAATSDTGTFSFMALFKRALQKLSTLVTNSGAMLSTTGSGVPGSALYIGGNKAGNLVGLSLDGSGNLNVALSSSTVVAFGGTTTLGIPSNNGLTVVKASAGRLASAIVTSTGSAQLNIYDNASQASGTIIGAVPAYAAVGSVYPFNAPAANGIVASAVASCCAVTICYY